MTVSIKKGLIITFFMTVITLCFSVVLSMKDTTVKAADDVLCDMKQSEVTLSAPSWTNGDNGHWYTPYDNETFNYSDNGTVKGDGKGIEFVTDPGDSSDKVMKVWTGKNGIYCVKMTFVDYVNIADISGLKIRTYYRVDSDNQSKIRIYSASSTSYDDDYVEVALNKQKLWHDIVISGENLNKIASNSKVNGFTVWFSISSNGYPRDVRNFSDRENSGYILFDSVSIVSSFNTITFKVNNQITGTQKVPEGVNTVEPDSEFVVGQIMKWFTDSGCNNAFVFGSTIANDITLYGKLVEYAMEDGYLFDGKNASVKIDHPTLINGDSTGWYNDAVEAERVSVNNNITLKTGTDAYYVFKMTFRNSVELSYIDSLTFNLTINARAKNDCEINIFAGNATSRLNSEKLVVKYSDYLSENNGTINLKFTREQMRKCSIDGVLNSFLFAVHAKGYDTNDWGEPTITINTVTFTRPVEIANYSSVAGTYYGNDGGVLILNVNKSGTFNGRAISYVAYESGSFVVNYDSQSFEGMIEDGRYSFNGIKYYKFNGQTLDELTITNFEPWDVTISKATFINSDSNGWVNDFYELGHTPLFVENAGNYAVQLYNGAINAAQACKITFKKVLPIKHIDSIKLRMYLNVGETYSSTFALYAADETKKNSSNKYEFVFSNISDTGYGWVNIDIEGDALVALADADGNLSGFNIVFFCNDNLTMAADGHVLLDSLTYEKACVVKFIDGENTTEVKVKRNTCVNKIANPQKEGFYFAGWFVGDVPFDFTQPVTSDVELTAKYYQLTDGSTLYGTYKYGDKYLSFNENNVLYFIDNATYKQYSYGLTVNNLLIIQTENTSYLQNKQVSIEFENNNYVKVDSCSVSYSVDGKTEIIRQVKGGSVIELEIPDKDGFKKDGWYIDGVKYTFTDALNEDIILVANYLYNEIIDYSDYYNSYYNVTRDTLLIFEQNNELKIVTGSKENTVKYYVLTDGTWIVVDGTEKRLTDNISSILFDGELYKKLSTYDITIDDGTNIISVTVNSSSQYKLSKPSEPVKDGYKFIGWYIDGQKDEFDFNSVIYTNIKLVAKWQIENPIDGKSSGCSSSISATGGFVFVVLFGLVAVVGIFIIKKREK